jgi:hypothetical protein
MNIEQAEVPNCVPGKRGHRHLHSYKVVVLSFNTLLIRHKAVSYQHEGEEHNVVDNPSF